MSVTRDQELGPAARKSEKMRLYLDSFLYVRLQPECTQQPFLFPRKETNEWRWYAKWKQSRQRRRKSWKLRDCGLRDAPTSFPDSGVSTESNWMQVLPPLHKPYLVKVRSPPLTILHAHLLSSFQRNPSKARQWRKLCYCQSMDTTTRNHVCTAGELARTLRATYATGWKYIRSGNLLWFRSLDSPYKLRSRYQLKPLDVLFKWSVIHRLRT